VDLDIAEAVNIIKQQGGKYLVTYEDGRVTGLEKVRPNQHLLSLEDFIELAKAAGSFDRNNDSLT